MVSLAAVQLVALIRYEPKPFVERGMATVPAIMAEQTQLFGARTLEPYEGYGTWVDVYDFAPSFQGEGKQPAVTPDTIDEMVESGVKTIFLQAAQIDRRSPGRLADPGTVAAFLVRAHRAGLKVVGWYLPRFSDIDEDLSHLRAIADFQVLGHRFDGIAVDIEWTDSVTDHAARSAQLVELSERLREHAASDVLGAIVLPPVQIEVVNPAKWPGFPWKELASSYDVWLPMGYWTERSAASGYKDGRTYTDENVRRIRANLDDPDAPVHAIGGIGDDLTVAQAEGFVRAVTETDAIGGSIYDWVTLAADLHRPLAEGLPD